MRKQKIVIGLTLFGLGLIGILSMLTMNIPLSPEVEVILKEKLTTDQIKMLTLINPTILLIISVIIGTFLYQKVNLKVPIIEKMVGIKDTNSTISTILKFGVLGGILSGLLLTIVTLIFKPLLPLEFLELGESVTPPILARFLYGGITEEILMRFGLMTLIIWVFSKLFNRTEPIIYWIGIIIAAIIFAFGHFPIAYQAVTNPSIGLLTFIIIGNSIGGLIFGWLYWKKGLESAFIAHISTHIIMILSEMI